MTPERWQRIKELFEEVTEREPADRSAFLQEACGGDQDLRDEVESLLAEEGRAGDFMKDPVMGIQESFTGRVILHYKVMEKLGEGGMGVVYKARDLRLDRFVALKVLSPGMMVDPRGKRRFLQEARSASALNHPNIITVHDIVTENGIDFIVMEYVLGKTLDHLIGRHGLRMIEALTYGLQIADALAKAHSAGIVHRDLKPSNIMVTEDGLVKVLDFGLAKLVEQDRGIEFATSTTTGSKTIAGTVAYMSPEQAQGNKMDARSDIFSFGAVLYEMITGVRAFRGDNRLSILAALARDEPPKMSVLVPSIPIELERVILRALSKDPDRRWQSMADMKPPLAEIGEKLSTHPKNRYPLGPDFGKGLTQATPARIPASAKQVKHLHLAIILAALVFLVTTAVYFFPWTKVHFIVGKPTVRDAPAMSEGNSNLPAGTIHLRGDFPSASVFLDDAKWGEMSDGYYAFDVSSLGPHKLRLLYGGKEFVLPFDIRSRDAPPSVGALSTDGPPAVLVESYGPTIRVRSSFRSLDVTLDKTSPRNVPPVGLQINNQIIGSHQISFNDGNKLKILTFETRPTPTLNIFLASNRDVGNLVLRANIDGVRVLLNGVEQNPIRGAWAKELVPGRYSIHVMKDGYVNLPARIIEIKRGQRTDEHFVFQRLTESASILIKGSVPGAEVSFDRIRVGSVGVDGNYRLSDIVPGDHVIRISKANYSPSSINIRVTSGQVITLEDKDVRLTQLVGWLVIHVSPANAEIAYQAARGETELHSVSSGRVPLPIGSYIVVATANGYEPGYKTVEVDPWVETPVEFNLKPGQLRRPVQQSLTSHDESDLPIVPPEPQRSMKSTKDLLIDTSAWQLVNGWWMHHGKDYGWIRTARDTNKLLCDILLPGSMFGAGRARWVINFRNDKDQVIYELDNTTFTRSVVVGGKRVRQASPHKMGRAKQYRIEITTRPGRIVHRDEHGSLLDDLQEPGVDFTIGKVGFAGEIGLVVYALSGN